MKHAGRLATDGHYLEQVDLMLFCVVNQVELVFIANTKDRLHPISAAEYLHGLCPQLPPLPEPARAPPPWRVILARADYRATNDPTELNHWLPAWPAEIGVAEVECKFKTKMSVNACLQFFKRLTASKRKRLSWKPFPGPMKKLGRS